MINSMIDIEVTWCQSLLIRARRIRDRMVVGFTTCAIKAHHHRSCELKNRSWQGIIDTTLCDKVCQLLATGRWFSTGTTVSSTNKTDRHWNIVESCVKHPKPNHFLLLLINRTGICINHYTGGISHSNIVSVSHM